MIMNVLILSPKDERCASEGNFTSSLISTLI